MQKFFFVSYPAQLKALIIGKAADWTLRTIRKRDRIFPGDDVEWEDIIVDPQVLPECFSKWTGLGAKKYSKKGERFEVWKKKEEEEEHAKREKYFDDRKATVFPTETTEQAPYDEKALTWWMRNARIPVDYNDRNF